MFLSVIEDDNMVFLVLLLQNVIIGGNYDIEKEQLIKKVLVILIVVEYKVFQQYLLICNGKYLSFWKRFVV